MNEDKIKSKVFDFDLVMAVVLYLKNKIIARFVFNKEGDLVKESVKDNRFNYLKMAKDIFNRHKVLKSQ
jgi:hypothetical protein